MDFRVPELVTSGSANLILVVQDCSLDDRDGVMGSPMITSHLSMELTDCSIQRYISVLFVHIVISGSGLISEDNSECFDMSWSSFEDLVDCKDLTLSSFGLELSTKMVPEFGFGYNFVSSEKPNGIYFGARVLLGWIFPTQYQILSDLRIISMNTFI